MVPNFRVFIPSIHETVGGRARDYRPLVDKLVTTVLRDTPSISAALGHGNYLAWIEAEFEMSERTAERYASIFDAFGGKSDNLSNIGKSALRPYLRSVETRLATAS